MTTQSTFCYSNWVCLSVICLVLASSTVGMSSDRVLFTPSGSGSLTPDRGGKSNKLDDELSFFKSSKSIGPAGDLPLVPESNLSTAPSKDLFKLYDRKKNWIFARPSDMGRLSGDSKGDMGLDKWGMDNQDNDKSMLARFLGAKSKTQNSLSSTNNSSKSSSSFYENEFEQGTEEGDATSALDPVYQFGGSQSMPGFSDLKRESTGFRFSQSEKGTSNFQFGNQGTVFGSEKTRGYLNTPPSGMGGLLKRHSSISKDLFQNRANEKESSFSSILDGQNSLMNRGAISQIGRSNQADSDPTRSALNPTSRENANAFSFSSSEGRPGGLFSAPGFSPNSTRNSFEMPGNTSANPGGFFNTQSASTPISGPATINVMSPAMKDWAVRKF